MRGRVISIIKLFLLFIFGSFVHAVAAQAPDPGSDTQSWNKVQWTVPLNKHIDVTLSGDFRLGRNISDFVDERAGVTLRFKISKYLDLAPGYEYVVKQPDGISSTYENRLSFAGILKLPAARFTIENRHLFERRLRNSRSDSTRYRNRLLISVPVKISGVDLKLIASDEVFYDWSVNAWSRNRFSVGVEKQFSKRFAVEVYYLRQNDGFSRPGDLHVIGTTFKVR